MIEFINVGKTFGENKILSNINLTCKEGEVSCLVGRNGAGKSTLINVSTGLIAASEGEVKILGENVRLNSRKIFKKVGFVLSESILIESFTAEEQLLLVGTMFEIPNLKNRIEYIIDLLGLPISSKPIESYSTGMKLKVSLGCALIHEPKVLILDEPFENLDIGSVEFLLDFLKSYAKKGATILLSTHQIDIMYEIGDRIIMIKNGEISHNLSSEKLKNQIEEKYSNTDLTNVRKLISTYI
jgi:ABC-2 type transport system ATP-binding protein